VQLDRQASEAILVLTLGPQASVIQYRKNNENLPSYEKNSIDEKNQKHGGNKERYPSIYGREE
jgi:hypothetical protein